MKFLKESETKKKKRKVRISFKETTKRKNEKKL